MTSAVRRSCADSSACVVERAEAVRRARAREEDFTRDVCAWVRVVQQCRDTVGDICI